MDARAAERYLLDLELFGMRFGLDRMRRLMTALDAPERRFASIHVVGTNGKTSTTRMIAAILERHGLRAGSYTSPHLRSFRERIEVGGRAIPAQAFGAAVTAARRAAELVDRGAAPGDRVTQFEALTAAAFHELARRRVDVAAIEAGLGGRYDATSVIPSRVQVLTGVALEHTRWLGPTLAHIAEEKLAVVRDDGVLVTGRLAPEVEAVAARVARERGARRITVADEAGVPLRVPGSMQRRNFALARAAAEAFLGRLDDDAVRGAAGALRLPGRLEVVARDPIVVLDGAHNPDAAAALADSLPEVVGGRALVGVVAILDDKDASGILSQLLPRMSAVLFPRMDHPRALPPPTLASLAAQLAELPAGVVADPREAVEQARALAGREGAVLVTGSLHLLADLVREDRSTRASML